MKEEKNTEENNGIKALKELNREAEKNGITGMSPDEIGNEIARARAERRLKAQK